MRFQPRAPFGQRQTSNVVVTITQEIEGDERNRLRLVDLLDLTRGGQVNASLEPLKTRRTSLLVERDDLRINEQRGVDCGTKLLQRTHNGGELRCLFIAESGPEPNAVAAPLGRHIHQGPDAVVFWLVHEAAPGLRRVGQGRQHGPYGSRVFAPFHGLSVTREKGREKELFSHVPFLPIICFAPTGA